MRQHPTNNPINARADIRNKKPIRNNKRKNTLHIFPSKIYLLNSQTTLWRDSKAQSSKAIFYTNCGFRGVTTCVVKGYYSGFLYGLQNKGQRPKGNKFAPTTRCAALFAQNVDFVGIVVISLFWEGFLLTLGINGIIFIKFTYMKYMFTPKLLSHFTIFNSLVRLFATDITTSGNNPETAINS